MIRPSQPSALALSLALSAWAPAALAADAAPPAAPAPAVAAAPGSTPASDENAVVRTLYRKGAASYRAGKPLEAREVLLSAWANRRTYDVAAALGQVELDLKLYRDAAEHLDFAIRNFAPIESEETLEHVKTGLATARPHVAALRVSGAPDGAELLVDGAAAGVAPLAAPLFLEPGGHVIEARLGDRTAKHSIFVEANTEQPLRLALARAASPAAAAPSDTTTQVATSERTILPLVVGGAVFVAGLGVGIGFRVAAASARDEARTLRVEVGPGGCVASTSPACAALRDAAEREDRRANLSTAGFVAAGVAAVATPLYWLLAPGSTGGQPSASRRVRVGGVVTPQVAAVSLSGAF